MGSVNALTFFPPVGYNLSASSGILLEETKSETWGMSKKTELDTLAALERGETKYYEKDILEENYCHESLRK